MYKYLVQYQHEHCNILRYKMMQFDAVMTWRELQKSFDPYYHYDNLKFFNLGSEVAFTG